MSQSILQDERYEAMEDVEEFDDLDGLLAPGSNRHSKHMQFFFDVTTQQLITQFTLERDCSEARVVEWALNRYSGGDVDRFIEDIVIGELHQVGIVGDQLAKLQRIERRYASKPKVSKERPMVRLVKWLTGYEMKRKSA